MRNTHDALYSPLCETLRHPQNRKYITYRNAVREELCYGHRQHAQKIGEVLPCGFRVMRVDRQTDRQADRHTYHNTWHLSRGGEVTLRTVGAAVFSGKMLPAGTALVARDDRLISDCLGRRVIVRSAQNHVKIRVHLTTLKQLAGLCILVCVLVTFYSHDYCKLPKSSTEVQPLSFCHTLFLHVICVFIPICPRAQPRLKSCRRERDAKGVDGVGNWEGYPLPSRLGGLGSVVSFPSGVRAMPRPKLNFLQSECERSHLLALTALNFHSKQRLSLIFKNYF